MDKRVEPDKDPIINKRLTADRQWPHSQAELEQVYALVERNQVASLTRAAFLERLQVRDAAELKQLSHRLRQLEDELTELRAFGTIGARYQFTKHSGRHVSSMSSASASLSPALTSSTLTKTTVPNPAASRFEVSLRQTVALQQHLEEQRKQMADFAVRCTDRMSSIEARLNERDASIVRLEQKESGTARQVAQRGIQSDATLQSVLSSLEHVQISLAQEQRLRMELSDQYASGHTELRTLITATEKTITARMEDRVRKMWKRTSAERLRDEQNSQFSQQRYLHEQKSIHAVSERIQSMVAQERAERLRFEHKLSTLAGLRMDAANSVIARRQATNLIDGSAAQLRSASVLEKVVG